MRWRAYLCLSSPHLHPQVSFLSDSQAKQVHSGSTGSRSEASTTTTTPAHRDCLLVGQLHIYIYLNIYITIILSPPLHSIPSALSLSLIGSLTEHRQRHPSHLPKTEILSTFLNLHLDNMCRSSLALYTWCHCQEAQILEPCHAGGALSASGSCDSVASDTVQLHCYCRYHAVKGFQSAHKKNKVQRRADKKEKRQSFGSSASIETLDSDGSAASATSSASSLRAKLPLRLKKGWNSLRRLSFDH